MKKNVLMSIAVLSATAVICVALIAVVNHFWHITDEERFARAVKDIMQTNSFEIQYDNEVAEYNADIGGNDNYGIRTVRLAKGGRDDGCYLFQSRGRGYNGGFVELLIGYTADGELIGFIKTSLSDANTYQHLIKDSDWDAASDSVKGKTYKDEFESGRAGGNALQAATGASVTLGGASEAIKISNEFFKKYISDDVVEPPKGEIEVNATKIAQLNILFSVENSGYQGVTIKQGGYVKYPITSDRESGARVEAVYTAEAVDGEKYFIAEVWATTSGYGNWRLLVLLDDNNLIAAVNRTGNPPYEVYEEDDEHYDASNLDSTLNMTALYKGKALSAIAGIDEYDEYLQGTTHPTESIDGLKLCITHVLKNAMSLREKLAEFIGEEA
ncbi:MAG: hypothetical protein FWE84_01090 [Firmicutes bacterium]|nr:hypothetical protein [Bacillota bacterium]